MKIGALVALGAVGSVLAQAACTRPPVSLRMIDLAEHPERYEGRALVVDIVERLSDFGEEGLVGVDVPEVGPSVVLSGIASGTRTPARVRGTLAWRGPTGLFGAREPCWAACYVLRASATEPLVDEPPVVVTAVSELPRWDRHLVTYEGVWATGFEHSRLDGAIWLDLSRAASRHGLLPTHRLPPGESAEQRVRVTGRLFARPGARYGHLGGSSFAIEATAIEGLAARAP
jgi:hypothetical protein